MYVTLEIIETLLSDNLRGSLFFGVMETKGVSIIPFRNWERKVSSRNSASVLDSGTYCVPKKVAML